jgi:hypothetical protein
VADLANIGSQGIVGGRGEFDLGEGMKKIALVAALIASAMSAQPGWAAEKAHAAAKSSCPPAGAREAEQALRYLTQLGIASNTCSSMAIYADFRVRNRDAIVGYQKAMIAHLHGNAAFDRWNTSLANQMAQHQTGVTPDQFCQQSMPMLEQAKTLDPARYRAYAAQQAASANPSCGK